MERVSMINGSTKNKDYDLSAFGLSLLSGKGGVYEGLVLSNVSGNNWKVTKGKAIVKCTKTSGYNLLAHFELDTDKTFTLAGPFKVWIEINQTNLDNPTTNNATGTGAGSIQTGASYPAGNYIALGEVNGGNAITLTPDTVAKGVANTIVNIIQSGGMNFFATSTGTLSAYVVSYTTPIPSNVTPSSIAQDIVYYFKANQISLGTSTLSVNTEDGTLTATIKKSGTTDLLYGDILVGQIVAVMYDGTNFQCVSLLSSTPPSVEVESIVDLSTYMLGEQAFTGESLFDEVGPQFVHGSLVTDNGSSFASTQSVTRPNTRGVRIYSKKKQRLVNVTKSASCTGTFLSFRTDAGVEIVQVPFVGNDATFSGLLIEENTYYRMEVGHSTTYTEHYNTYSYPFNGTNVNITNGSINNTNDAYRHNIININTREENVLLQGLNIGDTNANKRKSFPVIIDSTYNGSFDVVLEKIVSPSVDLSFVMETDNNGKPSGTPVHANSRGSIAVGSVDTLYSKKTLSFIGSFTKPNKGTICHLVFYQGTYGSETVNAVNFYKIYVGVNHSTTRGLQTYDGTIYKPAFNTAVSDADNLTLTTTEASANARGYRMQAINDLLITTITKSSTCTATRVLVKSDAGVVLDTLTFSGNIATSSNPVKVMKDNYFRLECDNNGASYTSHRLLSATFPQNRTNVKYISGSENGSSAGASGTTAFNIDTIDTQLLINNISCVSSPMFANTLLSKTSGLFPYKLPTNGVCKFAKEVKNPGENIKCITFGLARLFTGLSYGLTYNIGDIPGTINLLNGTNNFKVGKSHSSSDLFISSLPTL